MLRNRRKAWKQAKTMNKTWKIHYLSKDKLNSRLGTIKEINFMDQDKEEFLKPANESTNHKAYNNMSGTIVSTVCALSYLIFPLPTEAGTIFTPISQKKPKHYDIKQPAQSLIASRWQYCNLNPGSRAPETMSLSADIQTWSEFKTSEQWEYSIWWIHITNLSKCIHGMYNIRNES